MEVTMGLFPGHPVQSFPTAYIRSGFYRSILGQSPPVILNQSATVSRRDFHQEYRTYPRAIIFDFFAIAPTVTDTHIPRNKYLCGDFLS
jgi:hypothetical protein